MTRASSLSDLIHDEPDTNGRRLPKWTIVNGKWVQRLTPVTVINGRIVADQPELGEQP
jgi:hypothetical protein